MDKKKIMDDVTEIRARMDDIDRDMASLFIKRMALSRELAEEKSKINLPIRDKKGEKLRIEELMAISNDSFEKQGTKEVFQQIMAVSRKLQYHLMMEKGTKDRMAFSSVSALDMDNIRVIYQGVPGAYSYEATLNFFGKDVNCSNVQTWEDAMNALSGGRADYAVLPIENSSAGMVSDVYDLLVKYDNYIVADTYVKVDHALLVKPGTTMDDIQVVYSHPQALMQSNRFLDEHRNWRQVTTLNTALSAKMVAESDDPHVDAIASSIAGEMYGLVELKKPTNHNGGNTTRFIILSNKKIYREKASKVSICVEVAHETGSLYYLLSHFIYNNLNMTKIESRPVPGQTWEYRFFIDFEGNLSESAVRNALNGISEDANSFKILGNY